MRVECDMQRNELTSDNACPYKEHNLRPGIPAGINTCYRVPLYGIQDICSETFRRIHYLERARY